VHLDPRCPGNKSEPVPAVTRPILPSADLAATLEFYAPLGFAPRGGSA